MFSAGKKINFNIDFMKRKYHRAFSCIYGQCRQTDELLHLHLQETL